MEIVKMKLSELNPAAYNPRKELKPGDPAYEKLKASILSFGNVEPIVWNRSTGNVIGGHQRLRVLMDLGVSESEISVVELTEVDEKRLNIALNKITGEWDDEKLTALLADITAGGADVYSAGFDDQELSSMFAELSKASAHDDDFNLTAALEKASFVRRGDIWTVGRHRLMCGDATSAEDVAVLMDGKKANLILTDPPYGVSFQSSDGLTIQNDSIKGDDFYRFLLQSLTNMVAHLEPGGAVYVFHADTEGLHFRRAFIDAGLHLAGVCIWVKNSLVLGRSDYQWQHEPVLYGFLQNGKHHWYADRKQTTIRIQHLVGLGRCGARVEVPEGRFHRGAGQRKVRTGNAHPALRGYCVFAGAYPPASPRRSEERRQPGMRRTYPHRSAGTHTADAPQPRQHHGKP